MSDERRGVEDPESIGVKGRESPGDDEGVAGGFQLQVEFKVRS